MLNFGSSTKDQVTDANSSPGPTYKDCNLYLQLYPKDVGTDIKP